MRIWPRGGRAFLEVGEWRSSMGTKEHLFARHVIRCGVSAKVLLKATLISVSRLGCFTYGWLTLLEFMVQFMIMWIVVLSCSARMAFRTAFSMLRISECWLCLCQNAKFEALQHAPSLVISWLCSSLSTFIHSIVYATSLITHLGEQYSLTFVDKKKKKQQKDDHVILVSENRPGTVNICLYYWMCFLCGSLGTEE